MLISSNGICIVFIARQPDEGESSLPAQGSIKINHLGAVAVAPVRFFYVNLAEKQRFVLLVNSGIPDRSTFQVEKKVFISLS